MGNMVHVVQQVDTNLLLQIWGNNTALKFMEVGHKSFDKSCQSKIRTILNTKYSVKKIGLPNQIYSHQTETIYPSYTDLATENPFPCSRNPNSKVWYWWAMTPHKVSLWVLILKLDTSPMTIGINLRSYNLSSLVEEKKTVSTHKLGWENLV